MKIVNVTPGLIQIPPNGWGAVEKIIWEVHLNLLKEGHDSRILYLNEVPSDADIVHIHVANLANEAYEMGIPYYFTMHDHHAFLYGKNSDLYKENLRAMKNAIRAFVPAKYLVEYFDNIPEYFSHGVNTEYFKVDDTRTTHKLLCVANNGYAYNQSEDRKGFGIAIEAARELGLPITIAGPSNNKNYFSAHPPTYDKLTVMYDVSEEELLTVYKNHSIFLHPSQLEAGHPNLTLLEALSCGLPVVGTFEKNNKLDGLYTIKQSKDELVIGIKNIIDNYTSYVKSARNQAEKLSWNNRTKDLLSIYLQNRPSTMKEQLLQHYNMTKQLKLSTRKTINYHNIDGMMAEILGGPDTKYRVNFINGNTNETIYSVDMNRNCWAKTSKKYYIDWIVDIEDIKTKEHIKYKFNLKNRKVYIALDSKSLGDTLAWIPYVEEFRKTHGCVVVCSTFWNTLLTKEYPNIEFVEPGATVHNIIAMYTIGLFYNNDGSVNYDMHPRDPVTQPLQKIAADILGLTFTEIKPKLKLNNNVIKKKQVCIATHSTAQSKYWNNPTGWQELVDWIKAKGYEVVMLSQEEDGYMGNKNPSGVIQFPKSPIENVIQELQQSQMFIGISSGLSWVSWAVGIPTVMISGFTDAINEMQDCIRISAPTGKCSGCWHRYKFNPGDWNWCPDHKDTPRQFECSKEITSQMVIDKIKHLL